MVLASAGKDLCCVEVFDLRLDFVARLEEGREGNETRRPLVKLFVYLFKASSRRSDLHHRDYQRERPASSSCTFLGAPSLKKSLSRVASCV